jgi:hypothetical protein
LARPVESGPVAGEGRAPTDVKKLFDTQLKEDEVRQFEARVSGPFAVTAKAAPVLTIPSAPKPWGGGG